MFFSLLCIVFILNGCRAYYDEAMSGGDYAYMHTPIYDENDEDNSVNCLSAKYSKGVTFYENEQNKSGEISYHYGASEKNVSYALGAFVFGGRYNVTNLKGELSPLNDNYSYWGGGLRAKFALNWPVSQNFHWRVIGFQGTWYFERGSFYNFKKDMYDLGKSLEVNMMEDFIGFTNDLTNITIYPYTEFAIKIGDSWSLTPNAGIGYKINRFCAFRSFVGINLSYKNFNIWGISENALMSMEREIVNDYLSNKEGYNNISQIGISWCF
jgi:hypothetical protein